MSHFRLLRGTGLECDFICRDCAEQLPAGATPQLVVVCEGCAERVGDEKWDMLGWRGQPGIEDRPEPVAAFDLGALDVPALASSRSLAPIDEGWVALAADGQLWTLLSSGGRQAIGVDFQLEEAAGVRKQPVVAVHAAAHGGFAAVVTDYGETGVVVDTATGNVVVELNRGPYHPEQTPFPCVFMVGPDGDPVLIAATDWNRVDAFDLPSGALLTERSPTSYRRGEQRPDHYLDYFHGALHASPDSRWVLDDGWVWHPVGMPRAWDVRRWLTQNVRESEDGPSCTMFAQREYHWDSPMCWIDDRLVAIWGLGTDDEAMLAGVTIFDVEEVVEVLAFAGPSGRLWSNGRRLYAADEEGVTVWDPFTGQRTAVLPGLSVLAYNRREEEFIVDQGGELRRIGLRFGS